MITTGRSLWVVLLLLIASLVAANVPFLAGTTLYIRLALLWGVLILGSWLWSVLSLRDVNVYRQARTIRQQVGQVFEERFEITNGSRLPRLWIQVKDDTSLPQATGSRVLTWIGSRQARSYLAYTMLHKRGSFNLGPTTLVSGDIFGLFRSTRKFPANTSLLVVPYMVELSFFPSPVGLMAGGRALRRRTLEVTPYAAGVREYVDGDPLNRIHWPTTARRDRLMVKEFEQDPHAEVWIFADAYKYTQAALPDEGHDSQSEPLWWLRRKVEISLPPSTIEYVVSTAASVANFYIAQGREVGMATAGQMYNVLTAERGERQLGKILETLALLEPEGMLPLMGLVSVQAIHMPKGSTVVLITPSTQDGVVTAVNELVMRSMRPVVILIDAETFGGSESSDRLEGALLLQGIPVFRIRNHDNLTTALEKGKVADMTANLWWKQGLS